MNINRLAASAILVLLSFVLFIYPDPSGIFYTILRLLVFCFLMVFLYQFSIVEPHLNESTPLQSGSLPESASREASMGTDIQDQYDQLLAIAFKTVQAINDKYIVSFYMLDSYGQKLILQSKTNDGFKENLSANNVLVQSILQQEEAILFQQSEERDNWNNLFINKTWRGSECLLGVRIIYKDAPVGLVLVQTDHFSHIHERDRQLLTSLGHFISMGMLKLDNIDKLTMDNYYHYQIANLLNSLDIESDIEGLYVKVRNLCRIFFKYDKLTITEISKEDNKKFFVLLEDGYSGDTEDGKEYSISGTIHGRALRLNETINSEDMTSEFFENGRFKEHDLSSHPFKSILASPVQIDKEPILSIALEKQAVYHYSESDRHLLEFLSLTIGSIISWQKQFWKMHNNAIHDGLTGLLNHKAFMDRFEEELSRANRYHHSMVIAMLDLDKFKRINDTYSHLYGDYVIRTVAEIIKENVRNIDVVGRYGGEEYSILLINTDVQNSIPVAQRIIEKISDYPFSMDGVDVRMTISCGLAEFPLDAMTIKDLIGKADEAMYTSKDKGGNHVTFYSIVNFEDEDSHEDNG